MFRRYIQGLVNDAVKTAFGLTYPFDNDRAGSVTLRQDLDTIVLHGDALEKRAADLHEYAHEYVHKLRNVATVILFLLDQPDLPAERRKELIADLTALLKPKDAPPAETL